MADNYEDDHLKVSSPNSEQPNNHKPSPDQVSLPHETLFKVNAWPKTYIQTYLLYVNHSQYETEIQWLSRRLVNVMLYYMFILLTLLTVSVINFLLLH